ncbi:hypothetical protein D8I35_01545 [Corticibacter populi]|uniref:Tox-HNH-HHH domain-containing protein n=2 Tax=Corticibacter populi TaxID=1550736 RepID=A0A3M6QXU4_9BURK|nr:hypothetical protein D8I35_01545 [Corticibacter populi]
MKYAIDMQSIGTGSGVNAFGFRRDSVAFFRGLLRINPELFSSSNQKLINNRLSPVVDAQWVQHNPTHQSYQGAKIVHHHWMQGPVAIPIPEPLHVQWNSTLHPYR